jgi:hypothetical protein
MSDEMIGADTAHGDFMIGRLSCLIDGDLSVADRAAVETHLEHCEQCRATLKGLRAVKAWMSADSATPADRAAPAAWDQLRNRLPRRSVVARAGGWSRLAIAASVLVVLTASAVWWKASSPSTPSMTESPAIAPLEALARERLARMPVAKLRALQSSLRIIDGAIADAYAARLADPANDFVATYLDDLLKRKADALRDVIEMTDAEGAS